MKYPTDEEFEGARNNIAMDDAEANLDGKIVLARLDMVQLMLDSQVPLLLEAVNENLTRAVEAEKKLIVAQNELDARRLMDGYEAKKQAAVYTRDKLKSKIARRRNGLLELERQLLNTERDLKLVEIFVAPKMGGNEERG